MSNPNLQKIIKLTQSQYNTLANGGTVGDFTGLNDNYLYLIQEDYEFPTTTTARKILMSTSTAGLVEWQNLTANDIPNLNASKINAGTFSADRIPNLNASKINAGTFDIARIPTGTTASTVALGNHTHTAANIISWLGLGTIRSASSMTWGTLTTANGYTILLATDQPNGGGWVIAEKNGKTYMQIDGDFYVNEGGTRLARVGEAQPASDVYAWAKASTKPTYTYSEVGAAASNHNHDSVYLAKNAQAKDSAKLNGEEASYYLNYNNLNNKPTIPSVSNATITIKQTGINDQTFTLNGSAVTITLVDTNTWRPLGTGSDDACAGNDSRLSDARPASDVYAWAKASTKPSYNFGEISAGNLTVGSGNYYLNMRSGHDSYNGGIYYSTPGNEAIVFANKNAVTSWIFATTDVTGMASWTGLTPSMQIKNGCVVINKLIADGASASYNLDVNGTLNATTIYQNGTTLDNTYLGKSATAADSTKLNGQAASYYLNYNNLSNTPSSLPASDVYAWAKASTKPTYTASEVGALASDAKVVLYTSQSLTNIQKVTARSNIGAGTSDLALGNTATTAAAGNHTHTLSIASGGSSPTVLAANTTYTLTAGGSTLVFKTPAAGGGSAYYANQYNQWYYFSNSQNPYISSLIGLTSLTTYNNSNLFFGFNSIPEDMATSLSNGHNIRTSSRSFIMDLAIASGYMSQLVFGTIGYDITKIYARTIDAWGGYVGEPDEVSKLGELYFEASSLHGTKVVNGTRYEFNIGRKCHCIHFSSGNNHAFFNILTGDAYAYTSFGSAASILYNMGHRSDTSFLKATGIYGSYTKPVVGVFATSSSSLSIMYMNGTTLSYSSFASGTVTDSEINTVYEP